MEFLLSEDEPTYEGEPMYEEELMDEEEPVCVEETIYEEEPPCEVELVLEGPVFESLGDLYVCSNCGCPLTEIPTYNRFYCENCGLHY